MFPFNSSPKVNQDVYIFTISCIRKGPPLPLLTDLFRIQFSLYSDFKLLKTNEKSQAKPNLQGFPMENTSCSFRKPQANQVWQLTLIEFFPPPFRWEGGGELTYRIEAFNFKFSQRILYSGCFSISLFNHCWEEEESRIMGFWLGCLGRERSIWKWVQYETYLVHCAYGICT